MAEAKKGTELYYAVGPNCWGKGFTMAEAIKGARANWPHHYAGIKKPTDKLFSVWLIKSPVPIGFRDISVSDIDGAFSVPKGCDTTKLQTSTLAVD
jgi:hypothetical protein